MKTLYNFWQTTELGFWAGLTKERKSAYNGLHFFHPFWPFIIRFVQSHMVFYRLKQGRARARTSPHPSSLFITYEILAMSAPRVPLGRAERVLSVIE